MSGGVGKLVTDEVRFRRDDIAIGGRVLNKRTYHRDGGRQILCKCAKGRNRSKRCRRKWDWLRKLERTDRTKT